MAKGRVRTTTRKSKTSPSRRLTKKTAPARRSTRRTTVERTERVSTERVRRPSLTERIQTDIAQNNSLLNLILGALILVVLGVLIFNYFAGSSPEEGILEPAPQAQNDSIDVSKENLPGTYTVKTGDTLYSIAQNYYGNGFLYPTIVEENKLSSENIEVGQKITIPKMEDDQAAATPAPSDQSLTESAPQAPSDPDAPAASVAPAASEAPSLPDQGTGGAENQTIWGERISGNTYTVQAGDWLSTIAGRAYGDVMSYQKIAQANKITNPDLIEPGTVLQIPR